VHVPAVAAAAASFWSLWELESRRYLDGDASAVDSTKPTADLRRGRTRDRCIILCNRRANRALFTTVDYARWFRASERRYFFKAQTLIREANGGMRPNGLDAKMNERSKYIFKDMSDFYVHLKKIGKLYFILVVQTQLLTIYKFSRLEWDSLYLFTLQLREPSSPSRAWFLSRRREIRTMCRWNVTTLRD